MGFDAENMVASIAGGTSGYLTEFLPIGAFVIGFTIALVVIEWLIDLLVFKKRRGEEEDTSII